VSEADARNQGANAPEGIILGPGEGQTIGTGAITLKATSEETGGTIGFLEATSPPGYGPPRHVHYGCDELFYVLPEKALALVMAVSKKSTRKEPKLLESGPGRRLSKVRAVGAA
jgi:hypothetical protein